MGQSSSSHNETRVSRPPLKSTVSSSSTTTLKAQQPTAKRRKSIALPDLGPAFALTPTSAQGAPPAPWTADLQRKSKAAPPSASLPPVQVYGQPHSATPPSSSASVVNTPQDEDNLLLGSNIQDRQSRPSPLHSPDNLETTPSKEIPAVLDEAIAKHLQGNAPWPVVLPPSLSLKTSEPPSGATTPTGPPPLIATSLPPLRPPSETIVAPALPNTVSLPLGTGASATTSLIIGSPLSNAGTPIASPPLAAPATLPLVEQYKETVASKPHVVDDMPPSIALPAAAPLVALTGNLANDPTTVEAVKAATVDLGAGPDGVPTLLSWTPAEGDGREGGSDEGDAVPEKVYVTGTFAKDWTAKIELRKKDSKPDFTALVNLPPGPHRLRFIVDEQWKTSKNLPRATDQDGNLINYLQVSKTDVGPIVAASVPAMTPADEERYWREESQWTTEIPAELVKYGEQFEAEEAALMSHDEHNRILIQQGRPPEPIPAHLQQSVFGGPQAVPPPSLPAQLQRVVLNLSNQPGSSDDNSLLPKPDHSVLDHLAASPITKGLLSVGITKRYRRKFVSTVFYKPVPASMA